MNSREQRGHIGMLFLIATFIGPFPLFAQPEPKPQAGRLGSQPALPSPEDPKFPGFESAAPQDDAAAAAAGELEQIIDSIETGRESETLDKLRRRKGTKGKLFSADIFNLEAEFEFSAKNLESQRQLRDFHLVSTRGDDVGKQRAGYDELLLKRSFSTRALTLTMHALRTADPLEDPERNLRRKLREKINSLAWKVNLKAQQAEILGKLRDEARSLLNGAGADLTPLHTSHDDKSKFLATGKDLLLSIPASTAIVDFYRYEAIYADSKPTDDPMLYCAYVTSTSATNKVTTEPNWQSPTIMESQPAPDAKIERVELGGGAEIDRAVEDWLREVQAGRDGTAQGLVVSKLIWEPIAKVMAAPPSKLYVCCDGIIERIPWPALPIAGGDGILLEKMQIARLPYPQFVVTADSFSRRDVPLAGYHGLLVVGDVDPSGLPEASKEVDSIVRIAENLNVKELRGADATPNQVQEHLERSRVALFSMHGSQSTSAFRSAQQSGALRSTSVNELDSLLYSALHLRPESGKTEISDQILTADTVMTLNCRDMELAVLSACVTARGAKTAGEPALSMAQAFHIAGCQNVISSLWNADDEATRVLVEEFFRRRLELNETPIEALRQSQLYLRANPKLLNSEPAQRSPIDSKSKISIDKPRKNFPAKPEIQTTPAFFWAGIVLSGSG